MLELRNSSSLLFDAVRGFWSVLCYFQYSNKSRISAYPGVVLTQDHLVLEKLKSHRNILASKNNLLKI